MTPPKQRQAISSDITKELQQVVYAGYQPSAVWSDWLFITEASLRMLPVHAEAMRETGRIAQDPPDIAEEWARIVQRYGDSFQHLAYTLLLDVPGQDDICDILGPLYEEFAGANESVGQYFTPWDVAVLIAKSTVADAPAEVYRRMEQALREHAVHSLLTPEREGWIGADNGQWIAEHLLPRQHFEPIKIYGPAVGSGGMLLAIAAEFPRWMLTLGMVQFFGQDISHDCALMTSINMMLFGLNGWGMRYQIARQQLCQMLPVSPAPILTPLEEPDYMVGMQGSLFDMTHKAHA